MTKANLDFIDVPETVKLTKAETAALAKIADKKAAIDNFIKTVVEQGEARLAELNAEGRDAWSKLATTYKLDLKNVNYAISDDGTRLVPVGMNLLDTCPSGERS